MGESGRKFRSPSEPNWLIPMNRFSRVLSPYVSLTHFNQKMLPSVSKLLGAGLWLTVGGADVSCEGDRAKEKCISVLGS